MEKPPVEKSIKIIILTTSRLDVVGKSSSCPESLFWPGYTSQTNLPPELGNQ